MMENAVKLMHQRNTYCHQMESQIEMLQGMESSVSQSITQWQTQVMFHSCWAVYGYQCYTEDPQVLTRAWNCVPESECGTIHARHVSGVRFGGPGFST